MSRLDELRDFAYYFHFTLNPYGVDIEKNVPNLPERIKTFQDLSNQIGANRVIWRYDPILLGKGIDIAWHIAQFENLCKQLRGYTETCNTSFLIGKHRDYYAPNNAGQHEIMREFSRIARENGIQLCACAQKQNWSQYNVAPSRCTDPDLFMKLNGAVRVKTKRLDGQRKHCNCMPCVDIGTYNTCKHGCIYCYANGFYAYRGEPTSMLDKLNGEIYDRKTDRLFDY